MSQITILLLYLLAAVAFTMQRLPAHAERSGPLLNAAFIFGVAGLIFHGQLLSDQIFMDDGLHFSIGATVSLIGLQLAATALVGAIESSLRGMSAGLLALAAIASTATTIAPDAGIGTQLSWQIQAHIVISVFAYGLLTVGAIVAMFSLVQDRRLRTGKLSANNHLFAPLETTEKLLFGIAACGSANDVTCPHWGPTKVCTLSSSGIPFCATITSSSSGCHRFGSAISVPGRSPTSGGFTGT